MSHGINKVYYSTANISLHIWIFVKNKENRPISSIYLALENGTDKNDT